MNELIPLESLPLDEQLNPGDRLVLELDVFDVNPLIPDMVRERALAQLDEVNDRIGWQARGWWLALTRFEQGSTYAGSTRVTLTVVVAHDGAGVSKATLLATSLVPFEPSTATVALVLGSIAGLSFIAWKVAPAAKEIADTARSISTVAVAAVVGLLIWTWR